MSQCNLPVAQLESEVVAFGGASRPPCGLSQLASLACFLGSTSHTASPSLQDPFCRSPDQNGPVLEHVSRSHADHLHAGRSAILKYSIV